MPEPTTQQAPTGAQFNRTEAGSQPRPQPSAEELALMARMADAQGEHMIEVWRNTRHLLTQTLNNASRSYRWITYMNVAMFAVGLGLFATAAVYGTFFERDSVYPIVFSGLGAATFIGLFLTGAIAKTQDALSNLVQVEIAFMQWFEQMGLMSKLAQIPADAAGTPHPDRIVAASQGMQQRSAETIGLLQGYIETPVTAPKA